MLSRYLLLSLFFFAGCSVRPLYDTEHWSSEVQHGNISVDIIAERDGQKLRSYLIDTFRDIRFAKKKYRLTMTLKNTEREFAIARDGNAKRTLFTYTAHIVLFDEDGKTIIKRDIAASTSYNIEHSHDEIVLSLFGRHNDHLLKELAHRIVESVRMVLEK